MAPAIPSSARTASATARDTEFSAAHQAHGLGLRVNAGHGLNYENLATLLQVPHLVELNIGHSIISRAVFAGLETAVRQMLALMRDYSG